MDREREGADGSAIMGMCRVRNSMKGDNVMGSSRLDRLHGCTSSAGARKGGSSRLLCGAKMDRLEAPLFER